MTALICRGAVIEVTSGWRQLHRLGIYCTHASHIRQAASPSDVECCTELRRNCSQLDRISVVGATATTSVPNWVPDRQDGTDNQSQAILVLGHDDGCRSGWSLKHPNVTCPMPLQAAMQVRGNPTLCFPLPKNQRSLERQSLWLRDHNIGATTSSMWLPAWRWSLSAGNCNTVSKFGIASACATSRTQQEDSAASLYIKPWET